MIKKIYLIVMIFSFLLAMCMKLDSTATTTESLILITDYKPYTITTEILDVYDLSKTENEFKIETFKRIDKSKKINITINYPQLVDMKDILKQNKINSLIKESALKPFYEIVVNEKGEVNNRAQWDVKETVIYNSENLFSVLLEGHLYEKGGASKGIYKMYGINIDLKSGKIIAINDLFNESFKKKLNNKIFTSIYTKEPLSNQLFDEFKDCFGDSEDNFYFEKDRFIIIFPINGPYVFEANYKDLDDCMKLDNPIWKEILDYESYNASDNCIFHTTLIG